MRTMTMIAAVLLCVFALQWDLPPPVAGVPVELTWIETTNVTAAIPAARDTVMQIKLRENLRDGGAQWMISAAGDWILPPGRASPAILVC